MLYVIGFTYLIVTKLLTELLSPCNNPRHGIVIARFMKLFGLCLALAGLVEGAGLHQTGIHRQLQQATFSPASAQTCSSFYPVYSPSNDIPMQRQALAALYNQTRGPEWVYPSPQTGGTAAAPTALDSAAQLLSNERFGYTPWADNSASYCQW